MPAPELVALKCAHCSGALSSRATGSREDLPALARWAYPRGWAHPLSAGHEADVGGLRSPPFQGHCQQPPAARHPVVGPHDISRILSLALFWGTDPGTTSPAQNRGLLWTVPVKALLVT
ncbi:hypothetical protein NDU88_002992 [Pleurodeles waltl]|uniref:Uncharacterized protein n=1 Tax=Pleurodeles waltl TaxID=8319 RepID=A0AAV7KUD9_PLEWA|nr:hypothetical protein NDU88_002992 [Pleurodeles waltl]